MKPIYQIKVKDDKAELYIYGDIASDGYKWSDSDVSANDVVNELQGINAKSIDVYINSYGGEVAQGIAIYNVLKRHKAKVTTYVDGFACSIASVIAMAGDVRKMYDTSLLMIHNAWTVAQGNAEELRKQAEDLETINEQVTKSYLDVVNISEAELKSLLDNESWITADKALEMGFITEVVSAKKTEKASASAQTLIYNLLVKQEEELPDEPDDNSEEDNIESVVADLVKRVEELEKQVNGEEKQDEGNPDEKDPDPKPENKYIKNFLKAIQK